MEHPAGVSAQPFDDLGMLVCGVVVEDGVDGFAGRDLALDGVQEADDLAFQQIEGGEQGGRAISLVVVGHSRTFTLSDKRSQWSRPDPSSGADLAGCDPGPRSPPSRGQACDFSSTRRAYGVGWPIDRPREVAEFPQKKFCRLQNHGPATPAVALVDRSDAWGLLSNLRPGRGGRPDPAPSRNSECRREGGYLLVIHNTDKAVRSLSPTSFLRNVASSYSEDPAVEILRHGEARLWNEPVPGRLR